MESSPYTEPPKFKTGTFALLFGQSQSGKSTWLKNVLLEHKYHFETHIKKLVYVYQHKDNDNLPILMETFKKFGTFRTDLPCNIEDELIENHSILILDDLELMMKCKEKRRVLQRLSMETVHHKKIYVFFSFQTYGVFYKKSPLNDILYQATNLLLFRSLNNNTKSLKSILNAYQIKLKRAVQLYDLYIDFVMPNQYNYLMINLYPKLKHAEVYGHILYSDCEPMLIFHEENEVV